MKKIILSVLAVIVILSMLGVSALAAGGWGSLSLSVNKAEVDVGEEVTVSLYLGDCSKLGGVRNFKAIITVPEGLTIVSAKRDNDFEDATGMENPKASIEGQVVTVTSYGNADLTTSNGYEGGKIKIATLVLKASKAGSYDISMTGSLTDKDLFSQTPSVSGTSVKVVVPHVHSYKSVVTPPTCTEKGYTTYTCECGHSYTGNETAPTKHNYTSVVTPPTCTEKGYTTYTCAKCGHSYTGNETAATKHNYKSVVTKPTCTEDGYTTHTCSKCGDSYKDTPVAAAHKKSNKAVIENNVPAACETAGQYDNVYYCTVSTCKAELERVTVTVDALGHKAGKAVKENEVAADCVNKGSYEMATYCTVCDKELSREKFEIPENGHTAAKDYANDDQGHYHYCKVCGEQIGEAEAHKGGKWVCTEKTHKKSCTVCGFVMVHGDHEFDENGVCTVCGYDTNKDLVPPTGDITAVVVTTAFGMVAAIAAAGYMLKRKFNV